MAWQNSIKRVLGAGIAGELAFEGPLRAQPGILKSASADNNVFGRWFAIDTSDGTYVAGGAGSRGGILANPKAHVALGTAAGGPLAPSLALPNGTVADFVSMGEIWVNLDATAGNIGAPVYFVALTGALTLNATGNTAVPNATLVRDNHSGAGLAVIRLTN